MLDILMVDQIQNDNIKNVLDVFNLIMKLNHAFMLIQGLIGHSRNHLGLCVKVLSYFLIYQITLLNMVYLLYFTGETYNYSFTLYMTIFCR